MKKLQKDRVGIYSGTFDPIHSGHVAFALQSIEIARLDKVILLPERRPRSKPDVEHFGHRTAMITRAIQPHDKLALLELPDVHFTISKTLPKLKSLMPESELILIMGSDIAEKLNDWPDIDKLISTTEIVVGLRNNKTETAVRKKLGALSDKGNVLFVKSQKPTASSGNVRKAIRNDSGARGLLSSVRKYARSNWLYISLQKSNR